MFFNPLFLLFAAPGMILSLIAQRMVKSRIKTFGTPNLIGLTGAQVAQKILDANGISNVQVEQINSNDLADHYSPREKVLRLSNQVYGAKTITALGIAAHEVGHAIQDARAWGPLVLRQTIAPAAIWGQKMSMGLLTVGFFLSYFARIPFLIEAACLLFGIFVLFTLVTLPVEFDASRRAVNELERLQISGGPEWIGTKKILNAAALTYVAAAASAIGTFLYYLMLTQRRR